MKSAELERFVQSLTLIKGRRGCGMSLFPIALTFQLKRFYGKRVMYGKASQFRRDYFDRKAL